MTFYLIGLGLNESSITAEAIEIIKRCSKVYLENYTVNFPYELKKLKIKTIPLTRGEVEGEEFLKESKKQEVALLVYGDSLSATTHIQLIIECKKQKIPYKIIHNASIITAIAECGLQVYKFGKTSSMPDWKEHINKPTSFIDYIKKNQLIKAHTLLLTDIGLKSKEALNQLGESAEKENLSLPEGIIIISNAGNSKQRIYYDSLKNLKKKDIDLPFCIIIPSEMHFMEKEALDSLSTKI